MARKRGHSVQSSGAWIINIGNTMETSRPGFFLIEIVLIKLEVKLQIKTCFWKKIFHDSASIIFVWLNIALHNNRLTIDGGSLVKPTKKVDI